MIGSRRAIFIEVLIALSLALLVLILKRDVLHRPYYLDEMGAYIFPTHWLAHSGGIFHCLPGLHPAERFYGHPFLLYVTLTGLYRVFGESIETSHSFILVCTSVTLYFTYRLGSLLHGRVVGLTAAIWLFFLPMFFAESGMVTGDMVITMLGVMTLYWYFSGRYWAFLVTASCMVLTKESSPAIVFAIVVYAALIHKGRQKWREVAEASIPLVLFAGFMIAQKVTTGTFVANQYFDDHKFWEISSGLLGKLEYVLTWTFINQYKLPLLVIIALDLVINRGRGYRKEHLVFGLAIASFVVAFTLIFFTPRYLMPIIPLFFILAGAALVRLFSWRHCHLVISACMVVFFVRSQRTVATAVCAGIGEFDMQYTDIVENEQNACRYIEEKFGDSVVFTTRPIVLTSPYVGYVRQALGRVTSDSSLPYDIVVYAPRNGVLSAKNITPRAIIERDKLISYRRFLKHWELVEVFGRPDRAHERERTDLLAMGNAFFEISRATHIESGAEGLIVDTREPPRLLLPYELNGNTKVIRMEVDSPADTLLRFQYLTGANRHYDDEHSVTKAIGRGPNHLVLSISDGEAKGRLMVELGAKPGRYVIRSFEISELEL